MQGSAFAPNSSTCEGMLRDFEREIRHIYPEGESSLSNIIMSPWLNDQKLN